ncbi:hypothetical protein BDU57DRAFT_244427 [Ampelomyces quisqualis]|uniref:Uncharacterized protein n=1 Tax=Ampelomyces quisqualis TaxID=50730 RepID=A0A6A5QN55_AMPQU|nr:hypothetical protein BDU57DRAFT_244427 [Ampelomyces quisqualis]
MIPAMLWLASRMCFPVACSIINRAKSSSTIPQAARPLRAVPSRVCATKVWTGTRGAGVHPSVNPSQSVIEARPYIGVIQTQRDRERHGVGNVDAWMRALLLADSQLHTPLFLYELGDARYKWTSYSSNDCQPLLGPVLRSGRRRILFATSPTVCLPLRSRSARKNG